MHGSGESGTVNATVVIPCPSPGSVTTAARSDQANANGLLASESSCVLKLDMLAELIRLCQQRLRRSDRMFRYSGEEFVLLFRSTP